MTINNFRSSQALYLVIIRNPNAEQLLRDWAKSANASVVIENNRMKIFEQRSLSMFQIGWPHNWNDVTIWDYWKREHINLA